MSASSQTAQVSHRTIILGLAAATKKLGAATRFIGGAIGFEVLGEAHERWRLDLDVAGGVCREGDTGIAQTIVHGTPDAIVAFFMEPETIPSLCAKRALYVSGDTARLTRLASMLRETRSWLQR